MNWNLMTYGAQVKDNKLWFSNNKFNGLFSMDINTKEIKFVSFFPEERYERWAMHKKCLTYRDKIIFIPAFGNHIHVYDVSNGEITAYQLDEDGSEQPYDRVSDAIILDGYVYILPMDYHGELRRFNIYTGELEPVYEFMNQIRSIATDERKFLLTRADIDSEGCIRFALYDTNILCSYNISQKNLNAYKCEVNDIFSAHTIDGRIFLLTSLSHSVYEICDDGEIKEFSCIGNTQNKGGRSYNRVVKFGEEIIVLPAFNDRVYAIENEGLIEIARIDSIGEDSLSVCSFETCVINDSLWILPFETENCIVIGHDLSEKQRISFELFDVVSRNKIQKKLFSEKIEEGIIFESENWDLSDFLSAVVSGDEI